MNDKEFLAKKYEELMEMEKKMGNNPTAQEVFAYSRKLEKLMAYANDVLPPGVSLKEYIS